MCQQGSSCSDDLSKGQGIRKGHQGTGEAIPKGEYTQLQGIHCQVHEGEDQIPQVPNFQSKGGEILKYFRNYIQT